MTSEVLAVIGVGGIGAGIDSWDLNRIPDSPLCEVIPSLSKLPTPVDVFGDKNRRQNFVRSDSRLGRP
jgi:hypothetical protein